MRNTPSPSFDYSPPPASPTRPRWYSWLIAVTVALGVAAWWALSNEGGSRPETPVAPGTAAVEDVASVRPATPSPS
jgi:hypothetical protein